MKRIFPDLNQQRIFTFGAHRFSVCVLFRVHHSSAIYRHVVPSVRNVIAHTRLNRIEFVLQQKSKYWQNACQP